MSSAGPATAFDDPASIEVPSVRRSVRPAHLIVTAVIGGIVLAVVLGRGSSKLDATDAAAVALEAPPHAVLDAPPADAEPLTSVMVDASVPRDAVQRDDRAERCNALRLTATARESCGIAACNAGQRTAATNHYQQATGPTKRAIEQACKVRGIVFPATPRPPIPTLPDPCDANPLKCRR